MKIKCILGLTATATNVAIDSIVNHLDLTNDKEAIIRGTFLPLNLRLTVSRDHREEVRCIIQFMILNFHINNQRSFSFHCRPC